MRTTKCYRPLNQMWLKWWHAGKLISFSSTLFILFMSNINTFHLYQWSLFAAKHLQPFHLLPLMEYLWVIFAKKLSATFPNWTQNWQKYRGWKIRGLKMTSIPLDEKLPVFPLDHYACYVCYDICITKKLLTYKINKKQYIQKEWCGNKNECNDIYNVQGIRVDSDTEWLMYMLKTLH